MTTDGNRALRVTFGGGDHRRRRCTDVITSTCVFVIGLSLGLSYEFPIALTPARRPSPEGYGSANMGQEALQLAIRPEEVIRFAKVLLAKAQRISIEARSEIHLKLTQFPNDAAIVRG